MASVSLKQVVKRYGSAAPVIHGIDLEIADGELVVFVGPSGCGKSTLLRMIAGLESLTSGELYLGGQLANHTPPAQRALAMVFQSYALYPHMTVYDNLAFALQLSGMAKPEVRAAVQRAAEILQIVPLLARKPKQLSGGQRQRVAIGRAIVRQPQLFLFDEPLSNLDASLRVQMRVEISRLHRELGSTMIYVTHDQVEAMTLGQRIVVFNGGRIEQVGRPFDLYNQPANLFVAGFLGAPKINLIACEVLAAGADRVSVRLPDGAVVEVAARGAGIAPGARLTLGVRAEHLTLHRAAQVGDNLAAVSVGHVEYLGDQSIAYVTVAGAAQMVAVKLAAEATEATAATAAIEATAAAGAAGAAQLATPAQRAASASWQLHLPAQHCLLFAADAQAVPRSRPELEHDQPAAASIAPGARPVARTA